MKLLGFNFTKIKAEKTQNKFEELKISNKIDILDIKEETQDLIKTDDNLVSIDFSYELAYEEDIAKIFLEGTLLLGLDKKLFDEVIKEWKNKETPEEFRFNVLNIVLRRSTLKVLELENELNIPFHIQFPAFKKKD